MAEQRNLDADPPSTIPAGWYPDPGDEKLERLWDDNAWLDWSRKRDDSREEATPAGWYPDPTSPQLSRLWAGDQWTDETRDAADKESTSQRQADDEVSAASEQLREAPAPKYRDSQPPRRLTYLGDIVAMLLVFTITVDIALIITKQRYIGDESDLLSGRNPGISELSNALDWVQVTSRIYLAAFALTSIFFIAWFYRAYRNLPRRGMSNLRHKPGWAIGGWFVPILNLFRPKEIANDIWRGSTALAHSTRSWRQGSVSSLLHWWWGTWVIGSTVSNYALISVVNANNDPLQDPLQAVREEKFGLQVGQFGSLLAIVAAILAILIVWRLSRMQDEAPAMPPAQSTVPPFPADE